MNGTEKLKYSYLLEELANISIQLNDYEAALRNFIKCIETLDDLFATFHLSHLDKKYKTKSQLFNVSNRLSILHSNMALLLLKMNSLSSANAVLSKANRFDGDATNKMVSYLDLEFKIQKKTSKHEVESKVKNDQNQLISKESFLTKLTNLVRKPVSTKYEDGCILEAKYTYFFISALYEYLNFVLVLF